MMFSWVVLDGKFMFDFDELLVVLDFNVVVSDLFIGFYFSKNLFWIFGG